MADVETAPVGAALWANKIVEYRDLDPRDLKPHPLNWHTHPGSQQLAMQEIIEDVGVIDEIKVSLRTMRVINGHLRVQLAIRTGQPTVRCAMLDLTEAEELKALQTFDSVTTLAGVDLENFQAIVDQVQWDEGLEGVAALLASVQQSEVGPEYEPLPDVEGDVPEPGTTVFLKVEVNSDTHVDDVQDAIEELLEEHPEWQARLRAA